MIVTSLLQYIIFYITDTFIYKYIKKESTRYFLLHFIFNMYMVYVTWNTFMSCLFQPLSIFDEDYNYYSILSTVSIMNFHLYHLLTHIEELSMETMLHHLIGAIVNPIITIFYPIGKLPVMHNIILCGIPGGIDYLLLVLVKYDIIEKMTEKKINRFLNLLVRWPFIFLSNYLILLNVYNDNIVIPFLIFFSIFINNFNAIYFCDKVIGNYYITNIELEHKKQITNLENLYTSTLKQHYA